MHLAEEDSPSACWDDRRAVELLRKQASREELIELGMDARLLEYVFPTDGVHDESHAG